MIEGLVARCQHLEVTVVVHSWVHFPGGVGALETLEMEEIKRIYFPMGEVVSFFLTQAAGGQPLNFWEITYFI